MSILILIGGGSGSGKTTVADKIISHFKKQEVRLIKLDDYYKRLDHLTYDERVTVNYDHPDSLDFDLLIDDLKSLMAGKTINKPIYDFTVHNRSNELEVVEPSEIIILEGILVLSDERLREMADIKIYVDTDDDLRFIRRLKRDVTERARSIDSVINQYLKTVKPMHEAFVEKTKKYADIIIPNDFSHNVAVDILNTKIKGILKEKKE